MNQTKLSIVGGVLLAGVSCTPEDVPVTGLESSGDSSGSATDTTDTGDTGDCVDDQDCDPDWTCVDGTCVAPDCVPGELDCPCDVGATCDAGLVCVDGLCSTCGNGMVDGDEECDAGADNGPNSSCLDNCVANVCGDGFVGPGESCDDGNDVPDDGCDACTLTSCGDGAVDPGEECDDSNDDDTDGCTSACTLAACGDGHLQPEHGEACDNAANNSDNANCTSACQLAMCGDGLVHSSGGGTEECDNGDQNGLGEACNDDCTLNVCGDAIVGPGEACDDGNTDAGDGCSPICGFESCGNGVVDEPEACDDGANGDNDDGCTDLCLTPSCGDGFVQPMSNAEECDNGNQNAGSAACTSSCLDAVCGDGLVWANNEECDNGNQNANEAACKADCTDQICGDGFVGPGEGCDDGNMSNADMCTNACALPSCGDGFVGPGEQCDEGQNNDNLGTCTVACTEAACGDNFVQMGVGEECDNGNQNADTSACLTSCLAASCGDGFVWMGQEVCDDGNDISFDGCDPDCSLAGSFYGNDWRWVRPLPTGLAGRIMFGSSASDIWIGHNRGATSHYDGNDWTFHPSPTIDFLRGGWSAGPTDAWMVGQGGVVMHWNGTEWTMTESPATANSNHVYDVHGVSSDEVYAVGSGVGLMRWDGVSWSDFPTGFVTHYHVAARAADDPWVTRTPWAIWHIDQIWADSGYPGVGVGQWFSLAPNDLWVGGADAEVWRHDGNAYAAAPNTGLPNTFDFEHLHGSSADNMWATASNLQGVYEWDGAQWNQYVANTAIEGVFTSGPADGWGGGSVIYRRDNAGWNPINEPAMNIYSLADVAGELWVGGVGTVANGATVIARENNGNWLDVSPPNYAGYIYGIWGDGPNNVWAVGSTLNNAPQIWRYNGNAWTEIGVGTTDPFRAVWSDGQGELYVAGRNLYHWTGLAMQQIPIADTTFYDIHGLAPDDIWLAADNRTWHFDGNIWSEVAVPFNLSVNEIHGLDPDDLWGVGAEGVVRWNGAVWQQAGLPKGAIDVYQRGPADVLVALSSPYSVAHWDGFGWTEYVQHGQPRALLEVQGVSYYGGTHGLLYQP